MKSAIRSVLSRVCSSMVFYIDLSDDEEKRCVAMRIQELGGSVSTELERTKCTHVIAHTRSDRTVKAETLGLVLVSVYWLDDCETFCRQMNIHANVLYQPVLSKYKTGEMQLLRVSQSGFQNPERRKIKNLVTASGAEYTISLSKYNTHLVVPSLDYSSDKIVGAKAWGVEIVHWYWLHECVVTGNKADERKYQNPGVCASLPSAETYFSPPKDLKEFCRLYILENKDKIDLYAERYGVPEDVISFVARSDTKNLSACATVGGSSAISTSGSCNCDQTSKVGSSESGMQSPSSTRSTGQGSEHSKIYSPIIGPKQ